MGVQPPRRITSGEPSAIGLVPRMEFLRPTGTLKSVIARASASQPQGFELDAWLTRIIGNEAAHDVPFTEVAALWLDSNVEELTVYLFTVPTVQAQISRRGA